MDRVTALHHFTHHHKLALANCNDPEYKTECRICKLQILGPAYFCPERTCLYILHESCLWLPQKIQVPFHLNHMLVSRLLPSLDPRQRCYAYTLCLDSGEFAYSCEHCDFILHAICANSLKRSLKYDSVKHYCDFCEEERIPNDDIYYCEECTSQTTAHIECVLAELEILVANVWSDNSSLQLQATTRFTELLSIECRAPTEEVIQAGVVPRFVELLGSLSDSVLEQAVLAFGNITGDSLRCRDLVLGHGALLPLLALFNKPVSLSTLRNATWTLSMFCEALFDQAKPVLPTLARFIHSNDDEEVLADACWALSYLFDGTNDKIQAVTEAGVCGRLVKLLIHPSPSVITPALYTVRNIVSGDDVQTQCVISHQALPCLVNLLTDNYEKRIKNVACWTISNITAGNEEQIQVVIETNITTPLVHLLQAAWAIKNATSGGTHDQIKLLVSQGCIKPLCDLLNCPDPEVVAVCLQGLENILKVGEVDKNMGTTGGVNLYAQMIDDVCMNLVGHKARL
ncbi:hypothetical protein Golax_015297 [Gossypium laxum]|uniref:DC1 domain-containing protein n=1 Tax=Gossypium laxum TaxID=34288 RepID=A0A7J8ZYS3_9ROSI|nr:hypothetical protein [Gossypium laxum]